MVPVAHDERLRIRRSTVGSIGIAAIAKNRSPRLTYDGVAERAERPRTRAAGPGGARRLI